MEMGVCQNPLLLTHTSEILAVSLHGESFVAFRITAGFSNLRGIISYKLG